MANDLEGHLRRMKKEIEENGVCTIYMQRDGNNHVHNLTVLDSSTVTRLPKEEGEGWLQYEPGKIPPTKLREDEILRIDVRPKTSQDEATPGDKPKGKAASAR